MNFELSPELVDEIIFCMENQNDYFYLNLEEGSVEPESQVDDELAEDEKQYALIPRWSSADGFHLMERFVDSLRNPVYRERLRSALAAGKGVFRNFKNILKEREDIQRLWFQFKEREMKLRVREWYNQLREAWGYSQIGPEPEETDELVLSDFVIETAPRKIVDNLAAWDEKAFLEACGDAPEDLTGLFYRARRALMPDHQEGRTVLAATTPAGEVAGLIWGVDAWLSPDAGVTLLQQLYVVEEYRGLGLARLLVETFIRRAYRREMKRVVVDLWGGAQQAERLFTVFGFGPVRRSLLLDLDQWGKDESL